MQPRSPRLRPDRPFQVRYEYWFGGTPLNGMVWRVQVRIHDGTFITCMARDWYYDPCSLQEVLATVRYERDRRRTS